MLNQRGSGILAGILIGFLIAGGLFGAYYLGTRKELNQEPTKTTTISTVEYSKPSVQETLQPTKANNWKLHDSEKVKFSYPADWTYEPIIGDVSLKSSDFKLSSQGLPENGFMVSLRLGQAPFSGDLGLESSENTTWLGNPATLKVYKYEGNNLVLTTHYKDSDYQFILVASSDDVRNANKDLFLKVANTVVIK